ncbi:hypothetical protein ADL28_09650 [Streptomyces violaceusniger]|uniref:Uncharacterized protein n=2 Tax=Streptomyces violaceusniger group TaxID=2839105 RepID=A0ABD5J1A5_9ACTN|nr:hypothetical protein [Streptomyces violaceusniger]KUL64406.1 hypothetical protein ADL28_09650 [Streptomyces violaceusniger]MEE4582155.1 hypothetical protein [Streptomyces sp. DSM 41602]
MTSANGRRRALVHTAALGLLAASATAVALLGQQPPARAAAEAPAVPLPLTCEGTATVEPTNPDLVLVRDQSGVAGYRATITGNCLGSAVVSKVRVTLEGMAEGTCAAAFGTGTGTAEWIGPGGTRVGTSTGGGKLRFTNDADGNVTFRAENVQIARGLFAGSVGVDITVNDRGVGRDCWTQGRLAGGSGSGSARLTFG